MKNLIEEYLNLTNQWLTKKCQIDELVNDYVKKNIGFIGESGDLNNIGKTNINNVYWDVNYDDKTINIYYSECLDRFFDYWSDDKKILVKYNDLINDESDIS